MRVCFHTLGCKLNQYETEALASSFRDQGFAVLPPGRDAELYIVNTCTVTSMSEQKGRRCIRGLARRHPEAFLIVTGCYAQLAREELAALAPNLLVVPQSDKHLLLELPARLAGLVPENGAEPVAATARALLSPPSVARPGGVAAPSRGAPGGGSGRRRMSVPPVFRYRADRLSFHSRAFLKIQDGCDCSCAYCRVPLARGPSVSLEPAVVLERAQALQRAGYREVVLTGVNIGAYRAGGLGLEGLLRSLLSGTAEVRLRLSSLEPEHVTPALVECLRSERVCPHFHLPVQSGSDAVLAAMRRRYRRAELLEAVALLRSVKEDPFVAADFITGFPGENEEDFQLTRGLIEELALSRLHVFPFSPRPGTAAFSMKGRPAERVRDRRAAELGALSRTLQGRYLRRWQGREVEAVLERGPGRDDEREGRAAWRALSANYLELELHGVPQGLARAGNLVRARIEPLAEEGARERVLRLRAVFCP
jgi:threonylcarbamoyladenosine tRNA methylthiotransferase MtaB